MKVKSDGERGNEWKSKSENERVKGFSIDCANSSKPRLAVRRPISPQSVQRNNIDFQDTGATDFLIDPISRILWISLGSDDPPLSVNIDQSEHD